MCMDGGIPARSVEGILVICSDGKPHMGAATATIACRCLLKGKKNMEYLLVLFLLNPHEPIIKIVIDEYKNGL